ncbi:hypothetical protein [Parapusillimonas granuli]|uniref:Uncharacterized protein n=1 Tax=Parapusillimonas granuli TaxID=380911 RepID=A0A853FV06_9BURK|nr:hypothetical protein [Parapusillimonas granuli]MBB5215519.1 hypothetical protein [Parapusillimonas granuli]NYT49814.1 hypothetical protein [Parapusillimonas granuli]
MSDNKTLNLMDLVPGMRVSLSDGAVAEVVENPQDGSWIICRYLSHPAMPNLVEAGEQPVFATDIEGIVQ